MLDWLLERQPWIERSLANRHLRGGTLALYDVSFKLTLEGRKCPLAAFGHSRDGKKGKMQITYGLVCSGDGTPVAVEVFSGNTADPDTVRGQAEKLRRRFRVENIALVGDRGMITSARIREDLIPLGLDWISALRSADIRKLVRKGKKKRRRRWIRRGSLRIRSPRPCPRTFPASGCWSASIPVCGRKGPGSGRICSGRRNRRWLRSPRRRPAAGRA